MAYRRSIIARRELFNQYQQRITPSFSRIRNRDDGEEFHTNTLSKSSGILFHNRFLVTRNSSSNSLLSSNVFHHRRPEILGGCGGLVFLRNLSSERGGDGFLNDTEVLNNMEVLNDTEVFNGVVGNKAAEAAPIVNVFVNDAADSYTEYLIDYVHCYTGYDWWASIAVATLLLRFIRLPLDIHRLRVSSKYRTYLHPRFVAAMEKFVRILQVPYERVTESQLRESLNEMLAAISDILDKFGRVSYFGFEVLNVAMCFFSFDILNMAEKIPSFANGGILWFTDLTTPDRILLPVCWSLTLWIKYELDPSFVCIEGRKRPPYKYKIGGALALLGAITIGPPKAIYFCLITSNLFSIAYGIVLRNPEVRKLLGILPPSSANKKDSLK